MPYTLVDIRTTGVPRPLEPPPPYDPTAAVCPETYGGPVGLGISYERGTPVLMLPHARKVDIRLSEKWEFKLPWRKAGLLNLSRCVSGFGPLGCR